MSRIGKKPITIDNDVKVDLDRGKVKIEGPQGLFELTLPQGLQVVVVNNQLKIEAKNNNSSSKMQGLFRSLLQNAILGVKKKWSKTLELVGVGYRAETKGDELILHLGFSHPVKVKTPEGISFNIANDKITVFGIDKYLVGETAATIRRLRKPEPYKGKGIRYEGEIIRKKVGKVAGKTIGVAGGK